MIAMLDKSPFFDHQFQLPCSALSLTSMQRRDSISNNRYWYEQHELSSSPSSNEASIRRQSASRDPSQFAMSQPCNDPFVEPRGDGESKLDPRGYAAAAALAQTLDKSTSPPDFDAFVASPNFHEVDGGECLEKEKPVTNIMKNPPPPDFDTFTSMLDGHEEVQCNKESFDPMVPPMPVASKRKTAVAESYEEAMYFASKRRRVERQDETDEESAKSPRIGNAQSKKWDIRFQDLVVFKQKHGHCNVPNVYPENPPLAQWVKRMRYQHKLKSSGRHSTLTEERERKLLDMSFVFDSHATSWNERYRQLAEYYSRHGHSFIPSDYPPNQQLSVWCKSQRRQRKLMVVGRPSNMTQERIERLNQLDFVWEPRTL